MVEDQLVRRGVRDPRVLDAMRSVPRHRFLPPEALALAHRDQPVRIGEAQTISQPYIVALTAELAALAPGCRVLDVGTGSGYQAAVLAAAGGEVYSIEILPALAERARALLADLGSPVRTKLGDAWEGWPEHAPYRAILVAAASRRVPPALLDQLAPGGRLVIPVGGDDVQELLVIERTATGFDRRRVTTVRFVPMTGRAADPDGSVSR